MISDRGSSQNSGKDLLTEMRDLMRRLHYSIHTERAYCDWASRFVHFYQMKVRDTLFVDAEKNVEDFLTHLAVQDTVAASTQNQAFDESRNTKLKDWQFIQTADAIQKLFMVINAPYLDKVDWHIGDFLLTPSTIKK